MEKKKDWRPIIIYVLGLIIFGVGCAVLATIFANEEIINYADIAASFTCALVLVILYFKMLKSDFKLLNKKEWLKIVILAVIIIVANEVISRLFTYLDVPMGNQELVVESYRNNFILTSFLTVICAPIVEEMVLRYSLGTIIKNNVIFVITSAVVFGVLHGIGVATILYVLIGLALALIYVKSNKNIATPIIIHMLNNLAATIMLLISLN